MINRAQLLGNIEDIELSPVGVISVSGDVRSAIEYFPPLYTTDSLMGRVADILRRSGCEDAEKLIRDLEIRLAKPESNSVLTVGFDPNSQRITSLHSSTIVDDDDT